MSHYQEVALADAIVFENMQAPQVQQKRRHRRKRQPMNGG
jgi:hypothetical protein